MMKAWGCLTDQLFRNNEVLVAVLGICSSLGVTNRLQYAIVMGLAVSFITAFSSLFVSLLRKQTPDSIRMIVQLAIISLFTIIFDQFLQAYNYPMSKVLSVFVGLIITNCILMGRTEGFAKNAPPWAAFLDGFGAGLGYSLVLALLGSIREIFGFGELWGYRIIPLSWYATAENPDGYRNIGLMNVPTSAFFIIGLLIWMTHIYKERYQRV
jgi:Na+-transporting NADH:ubiquinone oxidoreductase subunit D